MPFEKQHLQRILENSFDSAWYIDLPHYTLSYVNKIPTESLVGYPIEDFFSNPKLWFTIVHEDDKAVALALHEECLLRGLSEGEYRLVHRDGSIKWILSRRKLVRDEEGPAIGIVGNSMDITQEKILAYATHLDAA